MNSVWRVTRIDDNGFCHTMKTNMTEAEATEMAAKYEKLGHKQTYVAEIDKDHSLPCPV
jgi:hypothetical protein